MNQWKYSSRDEIAHSSGFKLQLLSGKWADPSGLNPVVPGSLTPVEVARLVREGLSFAKKNAFSGTESSVAAKPVKNIGPNTLTLKKKPKIQTS